MEKELEEIEALLKGMEPAPVDESLSARLAGAGEGRLGQTPPAMWPLEAELTKLVPAEVPTTVAEYFARRTDSVGFPLTEKVVLFPQRERAVKPERSKRWLPAVAAAVMAGIFTALMVNPGAEETAPRVAEASSPAPTSSPALAGPPVPSSGMLVPASMNTDFGSARDQGLVWSADRKAMRVVRVIYRDQVRFRDGAGKQAVIEIPRVEYLLVPAEIE